MTAKTKPRRAPRKISAARTRKQLDTRLAELERVELVRQLTEEERAYLFKHALVQDTAYESLLKQERKRLHLIVAETLVRAFPDALDEIAAPVARHYAEAGDAEQTAKYAERAGDAAAFLFAYPEARTLYGDALTALERLPLDPDHARRRIDLLTKYVSAALRHEGPESTLEHLAQANALFANIPPPETRADRTRRARNAFWQGDAYLHKSQPREAGEYMQQALAIVEQGVDDETLAAIPANVMGRALVVQGQFARAQSFLERAVPVLEQTSNWYEWVLAKGFLALTLSMRGNIDAALAQTSAALARAQELGTMTGVADSNGLAAMALMQAGEYDRALAAALASFERAKQASDTLVMYIASNWCAWAELRLGRLNDARDDFSRAHEIAAKAGGRLVFADWFAAAESELELAASTPENALASAQSALEFAQNIGSVYSTALAHRVCGQALATQGQFDAALDHWQQALQLFETGDARLESARTHVQFGKQLRERGDIPAAREHFEQAAAQFQASGLVREFEETRALLLAAK